MSKVKAPISLRSLRNVLPGARDGVSTRALSVAAVLASSVSAAALAQTASTTLPPVQVDAPREKPHPVAPAKPRAASAAAKAHSARRATSHSVGTRQGAPVAGVVVAPAGAGGIGAPTAVAADADPYADPAAPYKVDRLSSSKFTEPLLNTPRTITVLTKEVLQDKNATSLREIGRSTAGVTLGTGEGGNAFGDRFFIRGFDARNDVFIDGIRDPGRQHPREFLHRAGRNPARPGFDLCRPRHRRRRHQHRHQAGDRPRTFTTPRSPGRHRPHQARHRRRQPGDQPDARGARRRPVSGRQRGGPQLRHRRSLACPAPSSSSRSKI